MTSFHTSSVLLTRKTPAMLCSDSPSPRSTLRRPTFVVYPARDTSHSIRTHDGGASQSLKQPLCFSSFALQACCLTPSAASLNLQSSFSCFKLHLLHPLNPLSSINNRTRSSSDLAHPRCRAADIRAVEEAHEEVHERAQVKHIQPNRKRLSAGVDTAHRLVLLVHGSGGSGPEDVSVLGDGREG